MVDRKSKNLRIIFIDMHCLNLLVSPYSQMRSALKTYKHKFLIDYALKNGIEIINLVSGITTTRRIIGRMLKISKIIKSDFLKSLVRNLCIGESKYVLHSFYGSNASFQTMTDVNLITPDDILIGYIPYSNQRNLMCKINSGHKVLMGNHFIAINEAYDFSKEKIEAFVNEIDLSDNVFIKKYFNCDEVKNIVLPYVFSGRFKDLQNKRKNKAMSIGTLSTCKGNPGYKLYRKEFGTEWIQPMRKEIYDHADIYPTELDSYISYITEDQKEIKEDDFLFFKIYKKLYNRRKGWTQSRYTSFDMVEKFNEYMMFVCPEELVGMPGIGFVEGMACGTAYIGLDTQYYRKLGLIPGEHYIAYDGTMGGLIETIRYYQKHIEDTQRIAKAGMDFVRRNFNEETVASKFFSDLKSLI